MSRASWRPFEDQLVRQLRHRRDVPKASAKAIAGEIVTECGDYLNRAKYEIVAVDLWKLRSYWVRAGALADELSTVLNGKRRTYINSHWMSEDHVELQACLTKLTAAASRAEQMFR